jgi:hypothetical protein
MRRTTDPVRVLLVDDEPAISDEWRHALESFPEGTIQPRALARKEFVRDMLTISRRRLGARTGEFSAFDEGVSFDSCDVLLVDFDLAGFDEGGLGNLTGEDVAYLARAFTRCGLIVAVNRAGRNAFDLTLQGRPYSYADLHLGADQITNAGLWNSPPWAGFRPWSWPVLPNAVQDWRECLREVYESWNESVLTYFGLEDLPETALDPDILGFLGEGPRPEEVTFASFVRSARRGLRPKDRTLPEMERGLAVGGLRSWLASFVLAGQETLADAPHLAGRLPGLLRVSAEFSPVEALEKTVEEPLKALRSEDLAVFRFTREHWVGRPAWYGTRLRAGEEFRSWLSTPKGLEGSDLVFCEDSSRFESRTGGGLREFRADVGSQFVHRFVRAFDGVDYYPRVRFAE